MRLVPEPLHTRTVAVLICFGFALCTAASAADLKVQEYESRHSGIGEKAVLVTGDEHAVLIDALWLLADGDELANWIASKDQKLTHILLTHGHPDHYMGLGPVVERFPDVQVLARQPIIDEIRYQFPSKWVHWQPMYGKQLPLEPVVPQLLTGQSMMVDGQEIVFIDLPPAETMAATAYYVPSARALIAGDIVFSKMHPYFADLNNPTSWIGALETLKAAGEIDDVFPGHGPRGDARLLDDQIAYMKAYRDIARPGVPLRVYAPEMMAAYPDYAPTFLWWTRGPGFGIAGPRALGVPEAIIEKLPPYLLNGDPPPD